jgi:hypothetical protein
LEVCIKALSHKRKLYLDRYARTLVRRAKLYSWKRKVEKQDAPDASGSIWSAPEVFALSGQHRSGFLVALALLRQKVGVLSEDVVLDFSKTTHLFADGMLLFYAELKRLIHATRGSVNIGCTLPENSKVAQVLEQVGVLRLLNVRTEVVPVDHDVVSWKAASGHLVLGDKYDEILQQYDGEISPYLQSNLYTGITEAMTNVLNHAYDLVREDGLAITEKVRNWWMFSSARDGVLSIVFCDLGAGIPRTLPIKRKSVWNRLRRKGLRSDCEIIKFAIKDSVSRTRKSHRGKGLRQIVNAVDGVIGAQAMVLSNRGLVMVRSGGISRVEEHRDSILGTLIFWSIPLQVKEDVWLP